MMATTITSTDISNLFFLQSSLQLRRRWWVQLPGGHLPPRRGPTARDRQGRRAEAVYAEQRGCAVAAQHSSCTAHQSLTQHVHSVAKYYFSRILNLLIQLYINYLSIFNIEQYTIISISKVFHWRHFCHKAFLRVKDEKFNIIIKCFRKE